MSQNPRLICLVEGYGEVAALPVLIRRIVPQVVVPRPIRVNRDAFLKKGAIERDVDTAGELAETHGGVLIVLDADRDCPADLGPRILERAQRARPDRPIVVALARAEFECWFLAAAKSLRGKRGLPLTLEPPHDPESVRGAKEWIVKHSGRTYSPTIDQPALAQLFDLEEARVNSNSFRRFEQRLVSLANLLEMRNRRSL